MKNNDEDKLGVAVVKLLCPICADEMDYEIRINSRLTVADAKAVNEMHNKCTFSKKPCFQCQKGFDMGGVAVIEVDIEKSKGDFSNPWRTGKIWFIKLKAAYRLATKKQVDKHRTLMIGIKEAEALGFHEITNILPAPEISN